MAHKHTDRTVKEPKRPATYGPGTERDYSELEEKIGYAFSDRSLLRTALTHSSYANEHHETSLERLEFLGDAVLGFITAELLYRHEPEISEGQMSRIRSENVCTRGLSDRAEKLGIGKYLLLSRGEKKTGGRNKQTNEEDAIEALIGAIYLDSGIEEARRFVLECVLNEIDWTELQPRDNKSALQELLQQNGEVELHYEVVSESGPDHDKEFVCRVLHSGTEIGRGSGSSKKRAEQAAAGMALDSLG